MISAEQYKEDMFLGVTDAVLSGKLTLTEAGNLRLSIKEPIDELRMWTDTNKRLEGHK